MQNTLLEAAMSFHSLCQAGLHIEFNNRDKIDLIFRKDQFYHLAGRPPTKNNRKPVSFPYSVTNLIAIQHLNE